MRKNKMLIFVGIILIVAMVMAMAAGCVNKNNSTSVDGDQQGATATLNNAEKSIMFTVVADEGVTDISDKVSVVTTVGNQKVDVTISKANNADGKNVFTVYPPNGYYTMGAIYKITIDKSLSFSGYDSKVKSIIFTITQDSLSNIKFVEGLITFDSGQVEKVSEELVLREGKEQEIYGNLKIQTSGVDVNAGDIIMVEDRANGLVEAYKIESASKTDMNAVTFINYVKPQINEVYEEFSVSATEELDKDSKVEFDEEAIEEELQNSTLAMASVSVFGSAPTFDIKPERLEDGSVKVAITMTIPGVVKVDSATTDLIVTVNALITADAIINADMEGNAVDCGVIANVYNVIDTTVDIKTGYSYSSVTNLTELIEKTVKMQDEANAEGGIDVPMFTWSIPVGGGAVSVTYQCDLTFKFSFAGRLGIKANSEFNYMVGATYDKVDGVSTYAEEIEGSGLKNVNIDVEGSAKVKLGIKNTLSLDILAGVAKLGIMAELGNFNGLYGFASTDNLVGAENIEDVAVSGAVYFEGGFYYDVDLTFAISIGSIANIGKNVDIADGEIVLYSAGEPTVVTDVYDGNVFELTALETQLPDVKAKAYDLKGMYYFDTTVSMADVLPYEGKLYRIENGIITVFTQNSEINETVTLQYPTQYGTIEFDVQIVYDGSLVLDKSAIAYDKAGADRMNDVVISLSGSKVDSVTDASQVTVDAKNATYNVATKKVTIPYRTLADMKAGENVVTIAIGDTEAYLTVNVSGVAAINGFEFGGKYEVFTSDQIKDLASKSAAGNNFAGANFVLIDNIDMDGATLAPVTSFAGVLDGAGYEISNYTVEGMSDNSVAFFAVNRGEIKNLTLSGNVNAVISAKTGADYYVAGAVGKNLGNGSVSNVNVKGTITMTSTSLNAFVNIRVMSVVANGNEAVGGTAEVVINAISQFDVANVTIEVDGSAEYNCSCANAAVAGGALVKFEIV